MHFIHFQLETMPVKTKKKINFTPYSRIEYLNLPDRSSPTSLGVNISYGKHPGFSIEICDCGNRMQIHGNIRSVSARKNALHKFDKMIEVLAEARDHLEAELKKNKLRYK